MKRLFDLQNLLGLALVGLAALIIMSVTASPPPKKNVIEPAGPSARNADIQATVNRHLEMTAQQMDLQRRRMELERSKIILEQSNAPQSGAYQAPVEGRDLRENEQAEQTARDLGVDRKVISTSPMDIIQQQLYDEQKQHEMDDAARQEYARQFVENARRGGYDVVLDNDLHVISAKPIRKPARQYPSFDGQ